MPATNRNQKPKSFAHNKNHKVTNFAYIASKPRQPKSDGLQNNAPNDSPNSQRTLPKDSSGQTKHDLKNRETQNRKCRDKTTASGTILDFEFHMTRCPTASVSGFWAGWKNV